MGVLVPEIRMERVTIDIEHMSRGRAAGVRSALAAINGVGPLRDKEGRRMWKPETIRSLHVVAVLTVTLTNMAVAAAADVATVATGGYARGLQTKEMMHKIDTNNDGKVSKDEWIAYQEHLFVMLDKDKTMVIDAKEFLAPSKELASFATGGYARGLQTKEMMHKIDQNGDGKVSHDEFMAHQLIVFETMDPGRSGTVGAAEFLGKGLGSSQK